MRQDRNKEKNTRQEKEIISLFPRPPGFLAAQSFFNFALHSSKRRDYSPSNYGIDGQSNKCPVRVSVTSKKTQRKMFKLMVILSCVIYRSSNQGVTNAMTKAWFSKRQLNLVNIVHLWTSSWWRAKRCLLLLTDAAHLDFSSKSNNLYSTHL